MTLSQEHQQFTPGNEPTLKFQSDATVKFQPIVPPPFIPQPARPPVPAPASQATAPAPAPAPAPAATAPKPAAPYVPRSAVRRLARKILGPSLLTKRG